MPSVSRQPVPLEAILDTLDRVLAASPADETEIVWIEALAAEAGESVEGRVFSPAADAEPRLSGAVTVRVRERGRSGVYRLAPSPGSELESGIRLALARARVDPPNGSWPRDLAPASAGSGARDAAAGPAPELFDPEIARLTPDAAGSLLAEAAKGSQTADGSEPAARLALSWQVGRVVVANSLGLRQVAATTLAVASARVGEGPGAGWAKQAARSLDALDPAGLVERAAGRRAPGSADGARAGAAAEPGDPLPAPLLLAPEAVAALVRLLGRRALSAASVTEGSSYLASRLGEAVLHPSLTLEDDATSVLPFPFDLLGYPKRPVTLVDAGVFRTPAVDRQAGERLGLEPTPHALGPRESRPANLRLAPGTAGRDDLLAAAAGGLAITRLRLARPTAAGAGELPFHAVARGVRRVEAGGGLGAAVEPFTWEADLARVLAAVEAVGARTYTLPGDDAFLGGVEVPALVVTETGRVGPA